MSGLPLPDLTPSAGSLERVLSAIEHPVAHLIDRALNGHDLSAAEGARLLGTQGAALIALMLAADELRRRSVGDVVTYVTVRNINFTNVCTAGCGFCAFSRPPGAVDAECLTPAEVAAKAAEAWRQGCTEVCLQGGLNPALEPAYYLDLLDAIKVAAPGVHVHAFSPFEVVFGARKARRSVADWLRALREAGLDSMPGTAAEIFDPQVRRVIAPRKISAAQWIAVVKTAHRLGIPTTATIMYGHVERPEHRAAHLVLLRQTQRETGGFTELVPLAFVHHNAPIYLAGLAQPGPTGSDDLKLHAVARLMLDRDIRNVQVSWVKLGPRLAQLCLNAGANDFGGTLLEERISSAAGGEHGQHMPPEEFHRLIRDLGRIPAQRSTTYEILRVFDRVEGD